MGVIVVPIQNMIQEWRNQCWITEISSDVGVCLNSLFQSV
jgi:hypothetical protein